jgi:hypothetical protein
MPMVGGKKFPYTEKGKAAAKKEKEWDAKTDGPVRSSKLTPRADKGESQRMAGLSRLPGRKGDNPGMTKMPSRKGDNPGMTKMPNRKGMNDDPQKRMADLRKTMLKRRLKSKGAE